MHLAALSAGLSVIVTLALSLASPVHAGERPLTFGVNPYLSAGELTQRFMPLVRFLRTAAERPVELIISRDYHDHIDSAGGDRLDIAFIGPAPYLELTGKFGPKPLLGHLCFSGATEIHGVIAVRADSDIERLDQLRGRRFAFGNRHSTLSHLIPWHLLREEGIRKPDLGSWAHLNGHADVALGVLLGRFDAGALKETVFERYRPRGLRAIARTPGVPSHVLIASATLDPRLVERLREALRGLEGADAQAVLGPIGEEVTGIAPAEDRDFAPLRRIVEALPEGAP